MRKPLAIVIDIHPQTRKQLEQSLKNNELGFEVSIHSTPQEYAEHKDSSRKPQVYFIRDKKWAKEFQDKTRVPVVRDFNQSQSGIDNAIDDLRLEGRISQKMSIGIIGSGILVKSLLPVLYQKHFFSDLHIFSAYTISQGGDYSPLIRGAAIPEEDDRVQTHKRLNDLISQDLDLLLIATGKHIDLNSLTESPNRKDWSLQNLEKCRPILRTIQKNNAKYLTIIEPNLPGPISKVAALEYGINPYQLTSFSADTLRYKQVLIHLLQQAIGPNEKSDATQHLTPDQIYLPVLGEHGSEIPYLEGCCLNGIPIEDCVPRIFDPSSEFKRDLIERQRKIGTSALVESLKQGGRYPDVPPAVLESFEDLYHFKPRLRNSAYCYLRPINAFLSWQVKADYHNQKIKIYPDNDAISIGRLGNEEQAEIRKQAAEQQALLKRRIFKTTDPAIS